jgi:hypothetical protein
MTLNLYLRPVDRALLARLVRHFQESDPARRVSRAYVVRRALHELARREGLEEPGPPAAVRDWDTYAEGDVDVRRDD